MLRFVATATTAPKMDIPKHSDWFLHSPDWRIIRDCLAGEKLIKARGEIYLPMPAGQDSKDYAAYKERAVFFNATKRTLSGLQGMMFHKLPTVVVGGDDFNQEIVTNDGRTFLEFAQEISKEVIAVGRYGVLVDKPAAPSTGPAYFATYRAEEILNWRVEYINDQKVLTQVVLEESYGTPGAYGIGEIQNTRYRVCELDRTGQYQQRLLEAKVAAPGSTAPQVGLQEVALIIPLVNGQPLNFIPFVMFGPESLTPDVQKAPLLDIASLNLSHYRSYADLEHGRHYTAMPQYYIKGGGADDSEEWYVGSNSIWILAQDDDAGVIEFNGQGLIFLENACSQKEFQIAALGGRLVGPQRRTAPEAEHATVLREKGEQAILMSMTLVLDIGVNRLLQWRAEWNNTTPEKVEFNKDFSEGEATSRELRVMQQLYEAKLLPITLLHNVYRKAGVIPPEMSIEDFKALLKMEDEVPRISSMELEEIKARKPATSFGDS